jgi:hypothetical protein
MLVADLVSRHSIMGDLRNLLHQLLAMALAIYSAALWQVVLPKAALVLLLLRKTNSNPKDSRRTCRKARLD